MHSVLKLLTSLKGAAMRFEMIRSDRWTGWKYRCKRLGCICQKTRIAKQRWKRKDKLVTSQLNPTEHKISGGAANQCSEYQWLLVPSLKSIDVLGEWIPMTEGCLDSLSWLKLPRFQNGWKWSESSQRTLSWTRDCSEWDLKLEWSCMASEIK
jgi:hypothetical protein